MAGEQGHWPRRPIDLDLTAGPGGWTAAPVATYGVKRRGGWLRYALLMVTVPLLAAGSFMVGATIGAPGHSFRQPTSWHGYAPGSGQAGLDDAVVTGGESGLALYSCRAPVGDAMQIGRFRLDFDGCHIGLAGKEASINPFEVLAVTWEDSAEGGGARPLIAGQTTKGGGSADDGAFVFPCRANYQNGLHPGYASARGVGCYFGYGGKTVTSQNYAVLQSATWLTWVPAVPQSLPEGAVSGGQEGGEPLFVCRAADAHGLLAGKLRKSSLGCSIASDGIERVVKRFEVLMPRWTVSAGGDVPIAAVPVGREASGTLFLCRGQSHGMVQPGRLNDSLGGCHVGMQGGETVLRDYEVLTE